MAGCFPPFELVERMGGGPILNSWCGVGPPSIKVWFGLMSLVIDMVGKRFGRLFVTSPAGSWYSGRASRAAWHAKCDCGNAYTTTGGHLREGSVTSCGCFRDELRNMRRRRRRYRK
jgi:hypothetical protein